MKCSFEYRLCCHKVSCQKCMGRVKEALLKDGSGEVKEIAHLRKGSTGNLLLAYLFGCRSSNCWQYLSDVFH